jgi:membrane protease YdiL (CAAX protease family)
MSAIITRLISLEAWILGNDSKSTKTNTNKKWNYLTPIIATLALGAIFAPRIPTGMAAGVGTMISATLTGNIANKLSFVVADGNNNDYIQCLDEHPLFATLIFPIAEEGVFRGILQPLTTHAILYVVPTAAAAFAGTSLSIAAAVSIVAIGIIFGLSHLTNPHKNAHIQAITITFSGIGFGVVAAQFGLPAAMAAHIVNNTIGMTLLTLIKK